MNWDTIRDSAGWQVAQTNCRSAWWINWNRSLMEAVLPW